VGQWREFRERERGGASLKLPQQEIRHDGDGWTLAFRAPEPVEGWNAQISLLTGMAAADIMLYGQVGILRTMPPADDYSLRRLRQVAKALRIVWPPEIDYPDFVRTLNPAWPDHAAMLGASLFREPAVEGRVTGDRLRLGQEVSVRLTSADYAKGAVAFEIAGGDQRPI
jgi:exoribonuclease R